MLIREDEEEVTTLDHIGLQVVDRQGSLSAWSVEGKTMLGRLRPPTRVSTAGGKDLTSFLDGSSSGVGHLGSPGDMLYFELPPPSESQGRADRRRAITVESMIKVIDSPGGPAPITAELDDQILSRTGLKLEYQDDTGAWRLAAHRYPREHQDAIAFEAPIAARYRLVFVGRHRVVSIACADEPQPAAGSVRELLAARHSRLGDVISALHRSDGETIELRRGDQLELEFQASDATTAAMQDLFLDATGIYTSRPEVSTQLSPATALSQNRPNPFNSKTEIAFTLARQSHVTLRIFDLQGRNVVTVADREYEQGMHAVQWDRLDAGGNRARPGVYLYQIDAGTFRAEKKLVLLP